MYLIPPTIRTQTSLGWLDEPAQFLTALPRLQSWAQELKRLGVRFLVQIGMGGSIAAARVFTHYLPPSSRTFQPLTLDGIHPFELRHFKRRYPPRDTAFILVSKSGTTAEVLLLLRWLRDSIFREDQEELRRRLFLITDKDSPFAQGACGNPLPLEFSSFLGSEEIPAVFDHLLEFPANIGGRFSAFSTPGLTLYTLCGGDPHRVASAVAHCDKVIRQGDPVFPFLSELLDRCRRFPFFFWEFCLPPSLAFFGLWVEQLVAESLGKEGRGIVPLLTEKPTLHLSHPTLHFSLHYRSRGLSSEKERVISHIGACTEEMRRFMIAVTHLGTALEVNPFDQPDVERTKAWIRTFLEEREEDGEGSLYKVLSKSKDPALVTFQNVSVKEFSKPWDHLYLSLLAYLHEEHGLKKSLEAWARKQRVPVLIQFGPRYLHSTGQLFKGGPRGALFILMTETPKEDLVLPPTPCAKGISLGEFLFLMARSDATVLADSGQKVFHIHFPQGWKEGLPFFLAQIP